MNLKVQDDLQQKYDDYYSDGQTEWRTLGAFGKFENIAHLSKGLIFNTVLEVGAGDGSILSLMDKSNFASKLYALEILESDVKTIKQRNLNSLVEANIFDGYKIPYPDKFFDLFVLSHVLEHVEYPRTLLREIKRV